MTKILPCTCKNAWQDTKYGKNMRVFNTLGPKKKDSARCTCCGAIKDWQ